MVVGGVNSDHDGESWSKAFTGDDSESLGNPACWRRCLCCCRGGLSILNKHGRRLHEETISTGRVRVRSRWYLSLCYLSLANLCNVSPPLPTPKTNKAACRCCILLSTGGGQNMLARIHVATKRTGDANRWKKRQDKTRKWTRGGTIAKKNLYKAEFWHYFRE